VHFSEWAVELQNTAFGKYRGRMLHPMYENGLNIAELEETLEEINNRIPLGNRMTTVEEASWHSVFYSKSRSHTRDAHSVGGGYVHLDRALLKDK
jgi:L-fucose dehydrogenase